MVITALSPDELVTNTRRRLGLQAASEGPIDDAMLAALLRRAAGVSCPCSPATLSASVLASLEGLYDKAEAIGKRIDPVLEALVSFGDLLELSQVTIDDPSVKGSWLFAAPPSFVEGSGGSVFLLGTSKDETTPLPESLSARITHRGPLRLLLPYAEENLPGILRDLGLLHLSQSIWLKTPKAESAADVRNDMLRRLAAQSPSGTVFDVSILDPDLPVGHYADRWIKPNNQSGEFIARRPQAYGAPIWGFASLSNGEVTKFLDFPLKKMLWRGCDMAWYLQMAIDYCRGNAQHYRRRQTPQGMCLDFFSPLPMWAHRRMTIMGNPVLREKCLFSFCISERELTSELKFLGDRLWLRPSEAVEQER